MISQNGKKILDKFVGSAKDLLMQNVTELLQQYYGIWTDGHTIAVEQLPNQDSNIVHTAKMLRERLKHLIAALPDAEKNKDQVAVNQLIAEQAFTQLNRFCALRMCEERGLILESIRKGYDSAGFQSYDSIAQNIAMPKYDRYQWYLHSIFDELSVELPAVFDRYSPYGLIFPDEGTLTKLFSFINDPQLSEWYDEINGETVNFWQEDETLGWMFQDYNSLEDRRKMREESAKPRNSREMAVRNQFFTPEYVVRFLTDNSLGRIWYEMTGGQSRIGEDLCLYMVRKPNEVIEPRPIKEPTEILSLDPTCGSMHFGLYLYEVYEYIYKDAWDNHPELLTAYREIHTRDSFCREIPHLILEKNIYGCEIDPRALQIAALSLWLRAQRSYSEMDVRANERPIIRKSNLVLAEAMPGNKRLLNGLMEELDKPMQKLITTIWDKMKYVGETGLLYKMEKEIDKDIEYLRSNWNVVNRLRSFDLFSTDEEKAKIEAENEKKRILRLNKDAFFSEITDRLKDALQTISAKMSEEEGYENALFSDDAARGFAFIELCQKRFDCIVMNPPFGEGGEKSSDYLEKEYPLWGKNLVCAFFIRMQEMLIENGLLGAIFDKSVLFRNTYEDFRQKTICGFVKTSADTGWGVLDANVETSTLVLNKLKSTQKGHFFDLQNVDSTQKGSVLRELINLVLQGIVDERIFYKDSNDFVNLPNSVIGYYFDDNITNTFKYKNLNSRNLAAVNGNTLSSIEHYRLYYEIADSTKYKHMYNGSSHSMFYSYYRELCLWGDNACYIKDNSHVVLRNQSLQFLPGACYGKRGEILDAHIFKKNMAFTVEGFAFPNIGREKSFSVNSFLNSILAQYLLNLYTGQHKHVGYVNLLPMPEYTSQQDVINSLLESIINLKRFWLSLDETNLEYRGFLSKLGNFPSVVKAFEHIQSLITSDNKRYLSLVCQNDDLWLDLAHIAKDGNFRVTLNEYKSHRPYEELLSIDGASNQNVIDKKVLAQEIVQELVGIAFGRWDVAYAKGEKPVPEFGDVFDQLPFMPVVSLDKVPAGYPLNIPQDGILSNQVDCNVNLAARVRDAIHYIWGEKADDFEYELCNLIGCKSLQSYFEQPSGFFDYHFKRYTKSRRKAPIYWLLSSEDGSISYWVYYPKLSKNTLPDLIIKLREEQERLKSELNRALASQNKVQETSIRSQIQQVEGLMAEIGKIQSSGYLPNHDDGVPVTSAPLVNIVAHRGWKQECVENKEQLDNGEYDWSHLAMSMYPARVTQKAKKDWCLALTHGLEHLCENKPKEKKPRSKKNQENLLLS